MVQRLSQIIFEKLLKSAILSSRSIAVILIFIHSSSVSVVTNITIVFVIMGLYRHVAVRVNLCVCVYVEWKKSSLFQKSQKPDPDRIN